MQPPMRSVSTHYMGCPKSNAQELPIRRSNAWKQCVSVCANAAMRMYTCTSNPSRLAA